MNPEVTQTLRVGYKASAEQFDPSSLLKFSVLPRSSGSTRSPSPTTSSPGAITLARSGGVAVARRRGQATSTIQVGTSVLTPTMRYHPSIVAQAFATLACLNPGRVFLGVGTGESMNETPATGAEWPGAKERRLRLAEAIAGMRALWSNERVDFEGEYYRTERATIYDRPDAPVPVYVAASGPLAAKLAGRVGDGFICTSGKKPELYEQLITSLEEAAAGAGREPEEIDRMMEIKVSFTTPMPMPRCVRATGGARWPHAGAEDGRRGSTELERLADENVDRAHTRFIVSADPDEVADRIQPYIDMGFRHLVLHGPGADQSASCASSPGTCCHSFASAQPAESGCPRARVPAHEHRGLDRQTQHHRNRRGVCPEGGGALAYGNTIETRRCRPTSWRGWRNSGSTAGPSRALWGLGLDHETYAMAIEEMSTVCHMMGLFMSMPSGLVGSGILHYGSEDQIQRYWRRWREARCSVAPG